ncbi:MAG: hypothetical protein KatS3mg132_045 [Limisphaera sp.]|nr:MAG: hypothetical protein KatS3mg132_045 [Limisphaera sp.]
MYKIIGGDGREYGPVSAEQIRQWVREHRANAETRACQEGANEWKPLREFPEFSDLWPAGPAAGSIPPSPVPPGAGPVAASKVSGPAIGLLITAGLGGLMNLITLVSLAAGKRSFMLPHAEIPPEVAEFMEKFGSSLSMISGLLGLVLAALVAYGAWQMLKIRSFGWALTAAILAVIPCTSPCCLLGLPIGIWALIVLYRPEVQAAFGRQAGAA